MSFCRTWLPNFCPSNWTRSSQDIFACFSFCSSSHFSMGWYPFFSVEGADSSGDSVTWLADAVGSGGELVVRRLMKAMSDSPPLCWNQSSEAATRRVTSSRSETERTGPLEPLREGAKPLVVAKRERRQAVLFIMTVTLDSVISWE